MRTSAAYRPSWMASPITPKGGGRGGAGRVYFAGGAREGSRSGTTGSMITRGRTALALIAFAVVLTLPGTARPAAAPGEVAPTPGAVNVTSFGAKPNDTADDTAGFKSAIAKAATQPIYAAGPSGKPQGVVYVPAGTYRVCGVRPLSNVRIEFDAGATMQLGKVTCGSPTILSLDGGTSNVSLVGVGTSTAGKPAAAAGWDISHSFRINADPAATGASPQVRGIAVRWVTDALIQNVFTVQNDSRQANNHNTAYTSTSPALTFYGLPTSTAASPQIPRRVTLANLYNIKSPVSYGAVQVSACVDCTFAGLFSQGGVTLRLETDAEEAYYLKNHKHYYSTVDRLNGSEIESLNGRQAVTMSPHSQKNGVITIDGVVMASSVSAVRTNSARPAGLPLGTFSSASSVSDITATPGTLAQIQMAGSVGWTLGKSQRAVADSEGQFSVRWSNVYCGGLPSDTPCMP